jgi:hypothetical protein
MLSLCMRIVPWGLGLALMPLAEATAHEIVGNRFFPATLAIDDPGVNDELAFPTISAFKNGDDPSAKELDISGEFSKRITENFAVSVARTWTELRPPDGPKASGFQNLETTFKYRLYKNPEHEFVVSVGLGIEWGGTGAEQVGAESFNVFTPTLFFGKGFGDLPDTIWWARPLALTGQVGYAIPGTRTTTTTGIDPDSGDPMLNVDVHPQFLVWGASLQYSMPYLKSAVRDFDLPDFFNHLIPLVEASFSTPTADNVLGLRTTGTINPGVIWVGKYYQIGIEAQIPINRDSGSAVGVIGQLHLYLDDIFPDSIGRPIFADASYTSGRPLFGN